MPQKPMRLIRTKSKARAELLDFGATSSWKHRFDVCCWRCPKQVDVCSSCTIRGAIRAKSGRSTRKYFSPGTLLTRTPARSTGFPVVSTENTSSREDVGGNASSPLHDFGFAELRRTRKGLERMESAEGCLSVFE